MQDTTKYLCENIQGCVLGYTQSDEITLVLVDYKKLNSSAWFDYEVQKMCSIAASMATDALKQSLLVNVYETYKNQISDTVFLHWILYGNMHYAVEIDSLAVTYLNALYKGAKFDARCFNLPKEEVTNCIYWRQLDASRNSKQMVGQANFSHKELQNKSCDEIQDMLMTQRGINWNDLPTYQKRGSCVVRNRIVVKTEGVTGICELRNPSRTENEWIIDADIPIFKGADREYIDRLIYVGEE